MRLCRGHNIKSQNSFKINNNNAEMLFKKAVITLFQKHMNPTHTDFKYVIKYRTQNNLHVLIKK